MESINSILKGKNIDEIINNNSSLLESKEYTKLFDLLQSIINDRQINNKISILKNKTDSNLNRNSFNNINPVSVIESTESHTLDPRSIKMNIVLFTKKMWNNYLLHNYKNNYDNTLLYDELEQEINTNKNKLSVKTHFLSDIQNMMGVYSSLGGRNPDFLGVELVDQKTLASLIKKEDENRDNVKASQSITILTDKLYELDDSKNLPLKFKRLEIAANFYPLVNKHCTTRFGFVDKNKTQQFMNNLINLYGFTTDEIIGLSKNPTLSTKIVTEIKQIISEIEIISNDFSNVDQKEIENIKFKLIEIQTHIQDHPDIKCEVKTDILNMLIHLQTLNDLSKIEQGVDAMKNLVAMRNGENRGFISHISRRPSTIKLYSMVSNLLEKKEQKPSSSFVSIVTNFVTFNK